MMRCPFPGMDPYIEEPSLWPDFQHNFIVSIRGVLQPQLRPRCVALLHRREYRLESPGEDAWEPLIHILDPRDQSRIVTAIEVLSPSNKAPGPGRDSYLTKRQEYWDAGTNLVEIDLLRSGKPTARIEQEKLEALRPWDYLVLVTRHRPYRQEVYAFRMSHPIPCVPIPLSGIDPDVPLDLQSAFGRCWEEGPYPELLRYAGDPPVRCSPEELAWSRTLLKEAGAIA